MPASTSSKGLGQGLTQAWELGQGLCCQSWWLPPHTPAGKMSHPLLSVRGLTLF